MKYHYVYIITNKLNHKFYIGKHSTNKLDDGYMGSGRIIKNAIQKYGLENFSKRILCFCDSSDDALKVEEFLVTENLIKRDDCYNANIGGKGGSIKGRKRSEETKKRISAALIGNTYGHGLKGKLKSDEWKQKMSVIQKKRFQNPEEREKMHNLHIGKHNHNGINNPMFGVRHSEESKRKMSEHMKGRTPCNKGLKKKDYKNLSNIQNG